MKFNEKFVHKVMTTKVIATWDYMFCTIQAVPVLMTRSMDDHLKSDRLINFY